jgi:hypothetical protein
MAKRWSIECEMCGKKEVVNDAHDLRQLNWSVLAWIVPSGEPRVICPKCVYPVNKITKYKQTATE